MNKPIVKDVLFLQRKCEPALKEDLPIADDLTDTVMAWNTCLGLAANMIGYRKRAIILKERNRIVVMFNPEILKKKNEYVTEEACLSLAGMRETKRYRDIEVQYRDRNWIKRKEKYSGLSAQTIQHEMDHLEGILI